jgi:HEAT repeat protein
MFWLVAATVSGALLILWFATRFRRTASTSEPAVSPFSHQHFEIFQSEELDPGHLESVQISLRSRLESESPEVIANSFKTDTQFLFQTEALAQIGSEKAAETLVCTLKRKLGGDSLEKAWVLYDLLRALKSLHYAEAIEDLLVQVSQLPRENPLTFYCAAEIVGFPGFTRHFFSSSTNSQPFSKTSLAWGVLLAAIEGFRFGVHSRLIPDSRIGEILENLWATLPNRFEPEFLLCLGESFRLTRRANLLHRQIEEIEDSEPLDWQLTKIEALEELLTENQPVALQILVQNVRGPDATKRRTALAAIVRLRWDTGVHLPDLLTVKPFPPDTDLLFPALCLTKNRNWFPEVITLLKRLVGKLPSGKVEDDENASVLRHVLDLLRQFPGGQSEKILLLCAKSADPAMRRAAVRNLGWWEPVDRSSVLGTLRKSAAMEKTSEVRWAAKAALARLGERKSLNSLRSLLFSEDIAKVHLGIHTVGNEGVSLLWPDLDQLMDSEDEEVSYHAWEATEKLGFQSEMGK